MANIRSFPNNQDEYIGAEDVMRWHHGRSSGVFGADGNAAVAPVLDAMAVTVSDGCGWLCNDNGDGVVWWVEDEAKSGAKLQLAVAMADAVLPRIDRVVVSWQTTNYVALPEVVILKGTPASNPVAPALTNDNLVRQISLAAIRIPAGATAIDASMIIDERLDESVCGIVTEKVGVDTTVMQAQFEAFWSKNVADFDAYMERQKAAWDTFFANVTQDNVLPVPAVDDAGKAVVVNETGDGFVIGDTQTSIPVTSEPPADADLWIDPDDETMEEHHLIDTNNPHGVTAAQVGATSMELLWVNASPTSSFAKQTVALNLADFSGVFVYFRNQTTGSVYNSTGFIGKGEEFTLVYVPTTSSSAVVTRKGTVDENGVNFMEPSNGNAGYDIPQKIYGIKGVEV